MGPSRIVRLPVEDLAAYAQIPIAFQGNSCLDLEELREGRFTETQIPPFTKDYDLLESPTEWPRRFDVHNWIRLETEGAGAIVAWNSPGVDMLEGREDLAVLWDIRVHPERRGFGLGRRLVESAEEWARERACAEVKVETQDNNVAACRFYQAMGFELSEIVPNAYEGLDEAMLIWRKRLAS